MRERVRVRMREREGWRDFDIEEKREKYSDTEVEGGQ